MKVKGILRGRTIELFEQVNAPDGTEVTIEIGLLEKLSDDEERLAKLNQLFGIWKDQNDLDEIFAEIDQERHTDYGRQFDLIEDHD